MRFSALDVDDEANTARIMLVLGIVKALSHNLMHSHSFPWRIGFARKMRDCAQWTSLPVRRANGNDPAAPQRKPNVARTATDASGPHAPALRDLVLAAGSPNHPPSGRPANANGRTLLPAALQTPLASPWFACVRW
jgi:hypothetical protein